MRELINEVNLHADPSVENGYMYDVANLCEYFEVNRKALKKFPGVLNAIRKTFVAMGELQDCLESGGKVKQYQQ